MNLDLDLSILSRFFGGILTELRQNRVLAGLAGVLVLALVAVPFVLAKSSSPAPAPVAQLPSSPPPAGTSIPTLNVQTTPSHSHLTGASRNPFGAGTSAAASGQASSAATATSTTTSTATSHASSTPSSGGVSSGGASSGSTSGFGTPSSSSSSSASSSPAPNPPSITGNATPKPAPSGLKPTQAYQVSMAITTSGGGINTVDPLQRLSLIPSDQQPLLIELGVEQGGNRVLFTVQPGAAVAGPGVCTPGPIDCEILSLGQDQTEEVAARTGSLGYSEAALFAITGITAADYPSAAAADRARRSASATGRALIDKSTYPTLSLFQYEPSLGSVLDLRNLKVGG